MELGNFWHLIKRSLASILNLNSALIACKLARRGPVGVALPIGKLLCDETHSLTHSCTHSFALDTRLVSPQSCAVSVSLSPFRSLSLSLSLSFVAFDRLRVKPARPVAGCHRRAATCRRIQVERKCQSGDKPTTSCSRNSNTATTTAVLLGLILSPTNNTCNVQRATCSVW